MGEFGPVADLEAFAAELGSEWPLLAGTETKDEMARGDTRRWGLPVWIRGQIRHGWLEVFEVSWPA